MSAKTFTRCAWFLIVGGVSACSSDNDVSTPGPTEVTVATESILNDGSANSNPDEVASETSDTVVDPAESDATQTDATQTDDSVESSGPQDSNQQNSDGQSDTDSQQELTSPETDSVDSESSEASQSVNFGDARLLVDLVPNGDSNPAKFHRSGDQLYFWTVDTDPRFANCAWHWGALGEADKSISFSFVSADPETGAVAMNRPLLTLGDFTENPNHACAGYNGSIMQVFQQTWIAGSAAGEEQFAVHFEGTSLGPDHLWATDGDQVSRLETGGLEEHTFFEGDKVFVVNRDGFWVSDGLAGDRRKLFETASGRFFYENVKRIARSHPRLATFEVRVGENRFQIWTYDLDTDEWVKVLNIKPDDNVYVHYETLLVDGYTLLSLGWNMVDRNSALGISRNPGDVTSFEILPFTYPAIVNSDLNDLSRKDSLVYSATDSSAEPPTNGIWRYSEERIEKLFSMPAINMTDRVIIEGQNGRFYIAGTRYLSESPEYALSLELWSIDPQTQQATKLSDDNWFSIIHNHPIYDEGYVFRYLNTPDGLVFINLTKDSGRELWFTDGTREGTRQLTDINPGIGNSDPLDYYYSEDAIYFSANDGTHGREPWMIPISR